MSGVEREWMGGQFVQVHLGLLEVLGGDYETAAVIWAIKWHAGTGWWAATREELQQATMLTEHKLRRALKRARDDGYVQSRDSGSYDRTLSWSVIWAGEEAPAHVADTATSTGGKRHIDVPDTATSSSSKKKKTSSEARSKPRTAAPESLEPNEATRRAAEELGVQLTPALIAQCLDHHRAKGSKLVDWQAALRTWVRNEARWNGGRRTAEGGVPTTLAELNDEDEAYVRQAVWQRPESTDGLDLSTAEGRAEKKRRHQQRIADEIADLYRRRA